MTVLAIERTELPSDITVSDAFALLAHDPITGERLRSYTASWAYKACALVDLLHQGYLRLNGDRVEVALTHVEDGHVASMVLSSFENSGEPLPARFVIQDLQVVPLFERSVVASLVKRGFVSQVPGEALGGSRLKCANPGVYESITGEVRSVLEGDSQPGFRLAGLIMLLDYFHLLSPATGVPRHQYERAMLGMKQTAALEGAPGDELPSRIKNLHEIFVDAVVCAAG